MGDMVFNGGTALFWTPFLRKKTFFILCVWKTPAFHVVLHQQIIHVMKLLNIVSCCPDEACGRFGIKGRRYWFIAARLLASIIERFSASEFQCQWRHKRYKPTIRMGKALSVLIPVMASMPVISFAQADNKYLAGAVPEEEGKVVFRKEYELKRANRDAIYERVYNWLTERMKANENNSRILFAKKEEGQIVAQGEEYLVFSSNALSLDRTLMSYHITAFCGQNKCIIQVDHIRYRYEDKRFSAEEQISDKMALNKKKNAIFRGNRKFRMFTVNFVEALFENAEEALDLRNVATPVSPVAEASLQQLAAVPVAKTATGENVSSTRVDHASATSATNHPAAPISAQPANAPAADVLPTATSPDISSSLSGYKPLPPDKIPGNIIKMLNEDWMLITAGTDAHFNMMTASWGGLGVLYGKPMALCFINPTRYTYQLMEKNDTYTLTFYTEAYREALKYCGSNSGRDKDKVKGSGLTPVTTPSGSKAFAEAWLIIECRKLVEQSLSYDALFDEKVKSEWTGKQLHKMYIGEIINVWVK
jgi:flavin reductase (DIM6/NTAB) family NADH-FMN oxidoreductase RutF